MSYRSTANGNKALAEQIRGFVAMMPGIETERHQIMQKLAQKFSKPAERLHRTPPGTMPQPDLENKRAAVLQENQKGKNIER